MKQVVQHYRSGKLSVEEVPAPTVRPGGLLVATRASLISVGTERATVGVAKKSLHMRGMAIDLRVPDVPTARLRELAISLKAGGVGYYGKSDFIHMDIGRVRFW